MGLTTPPQVRTLRPSRNADERVTGVRAREEGSEEEGHEATATPLRKRIRSSKDALLASGRSGRLDGAASTPSASGGSEARQLLDAQRALLGSFTREIGTRFSRMEERFRKLEGNVNTRLNKCEEAISVSLQFLGTLHKREGNNYVNLQLASMDKVYSGEFFIRVFGVKLVSFLNAATGAIETEEMNDWDLHYDAMVSQVTEVLHGLVFRKLPSERLKQHVQRTKAYKIGMQFRQGLVTDLIRLAEKNKSIGLESASLVDGNPRFVRPRWLRPNFIRSKFIAEVMKEMETRGSKGEHTPSRKSRTAGGDKGEVSVFGGAFVEEGRERKMIGEEIVRRLRERHVQQMNKTREVVRAEFFTCLGFIWHADAGVLIKGTLGNNHDGFRSAPDAVRAGEGRAATVVRATNLSRWNEFRSVVESDMKFVVEYEVDVYKVKVMEGEPLSCLLRREISPLSAALKFCTRMALCQKADDFLALHSKSIRVVYAVACVFKEMIRSRVADSDFDLPNDDSTDAPDIRKLETLVFDLVPSTYKRRKTCFQQTLRSLTEEEFQKMHLSDDGDDDTEHPDVPTTSDVDGTLFMDQSDEEAVGEIDHEVEELAAVQFGA